MFLADTQYLVSRRQILAWAGTAGIHLYRPS